MDLTPFSFINPCGFAGLHMTQVADCVDGPGVISWQNMAEGLAASFGQTMGNIIAGAAVPNLALTKLPPPDPVSAEMKTHIFWLTLVVFAVALSAYLLQPAFGYANRCS